VSEQPPLSPISFHLSLTARLRAYIVAGVVVTAPFAITMYLAWLVVTFIDEKVTRLLPADYNPNTYLPFTVPGLGLVIVVWLLASIGWLTAGIIGRIWWRIAEATVARMPIVRSIYTAVKQIFESLLAARSTTFRQVVLVEFPRKGIWRIGFVTGTIPGRIQTIAPGGLINVFIPNTPNVTAGFLALFSPGEVIEIDLSPEDALKLLVSAGIAIPTPKRAPTGG
jgi:uncharacterized membrane protein